MVADRIQAIIDNCIEKSIPNNRLVGGQIFDTANWNLVLKGGLQYSCKGSRVKERTLETPSLEAQHLKRDDSTLSPRQDWGSPVNTLPLSLNDEIID